MNENQKKFWKLMLIVVPLVISQIGSYMKSRAEAQNDNKAAYELLRKAVEELQKDANDKDEHIYALEGQVLVLKDVFVKTEAKVSAAHPGLKSKDGDGVPEKLPAMPRKRPAMLNSTLPSDFSDVVQQYKSKK